ncbi:gamma-glutamylaminecyclotransferase C-like [Antennarius striatus]|uniref:gamma-glutamylaminecyclotransferase C-like n=1 Tax=Antennarius striatus TaxID=241820 RepID=UPI0035B1933E
MTHIFVYGTLMKGQPNHYRMFDKANGEAEFLASACTTQKYPLVIATQFNVPFLLNDPGQGHHIQGEIYRVDQRMLKFLDEFEDMYQRTLVQLEVKGTQSRADGGEERLEPGNLTEAYGYTKVQYPPEWRSLPTYERYDTSGDHGLRYVTREERGSRI